MTDADAVERAVAAFAPDVVVHCAAWTDVDGAEADEAGALRLNADATGHVAAAARRAGARVVTISTDYVFDGANPAGYVESDATGPISAYGRTKLAGEEAARAAHPDGAYVVRSAWIYDEAGTNFLRTMLRLAAERGAVSVVTDQIGSPTYAGHLAVALADLVERCAPGTYHLAAAGHELARLRGGHLRGRRRRLRALETTSDAFPRPARRPACSILRSEHPGAPVLPPWGGAPRLPVPHGGPSR